MSGKGIQQVTILGWGEWGDWPEVIAYKDLEGFKELDRSVVQPDVGKVVLDVIDQFGGGVMGTVVPDAEYGGICAMGVGLNEGMGCEESVGRIDYQVKCEDDLFMVSSVPLKVMF